MTPEESFLNWFSFDSLVNLYNSKFRYRCTPGLDHIGAASFSADLTHNIETINRKVLNQSYKFTKYNELLISKGRNKAPRCVSKPTIRDKLALCALHGYLQEMYEGEIDNQLIHSKIDAVIHNIPNYSHYIKIDIKGYYSSIDHDILLSELQGTVPKSALDLVRKAITTPTVPRNFNAKQSTIKPTVSGVPEGLSISNLLANIYLSEVDNHFKNDHTLFYCRYVDDILFLANESSIDCIKEKIQNLLSARKLTIHDFCDNGKSCVECCDSGFSYLGYRYTKSLISVKPETIDRFEHSIERMFSEYKRIECSPQKDKSHNIDAFAWQLNLKIAGCIVGNQKYGWMFFYSQISDLSLLRHLDWLVAKLYRRFRIEESSLERKSFFKTYLEIKYNLRGSSYLCNIDRMTQAEKQRIIIEIYQREAPKTSEEVDDAFMKIIRSSLKELERDVQFFS